MKTPLLIDANNQNSRDDFLIRVETLNDNPDMKVVIKHLINICIKLFRNYHKPGTMEQTDENNF